MAAIIKTIITTLTNITDADGALGYGTIRVRPAQEFEYAGTASDLFTVTTNAQEVVIAAGVISSGTLLLAPNTGASNSPSTSHYIVDIDINGVESRQYWQIDTADGGAGSQNIEFANVTRLPNAVGEGNSTDELLALNDPFPQYAKRSDTAQAATTYPNLTADSLDASLGQIVRADVNTGHLPTDSVIAASVKNLTLTGAKLAAATVTEDKIFSGTKWFAGVTITQLGGGGGSISLSDGKAGKSGNYRTGVVTNSADTTTGKITIYDTGAAGRYVKLYLPTTVSAVLTTECTLILTKIDNVTVDADIGVLCAKPDANGLYWEIYVDQTDGAATVAGAGGPPATSVDITYHITILKHW